MMGIQEVGAALIGGGVVALVVMAKSSREERILSEAERPDTCGGCGDALPFDWALGDYPAACGGCLSELFETAQREMGEF